MLTTAITGHTSNWAPVAISAAWDAANPLEVTFTFAPPSSDPNCTVVWTFARGLMLAGLQSFTWAGLGDVQARSTSEEFCLQLRSDKGADTISMPREQIVWLAEESVREIAPGSDEETAAYDSAVDEALARWFA